MKPQDLRYPIKIKERTCVLNQEERYLYLPNYYYDFKTDNQLNIKELFPDCRFFSIEYCSGNGDWVIERASQDPFTGWLAVEIRFDRARKIWSKMKNRNIKNVFILCGEGLLLSRSFLPPTAFDSIYVNFPDPWPKKRHAGKRILSTPFIQEMSRLLKPSGEFRIATDASDYASDMKLLFDQEKDFIPEEKTQSFEEYGHSFFGSLWHSRGLQIHFLSYRKNGV